MAGRGTLFLVVGPSGAGKDSLIAAARQALADDPGYVFPRRAITRPAEAGGEGHLALTAAAFEAEWRAGGFALAWHSHGLGYGIPRAIESELAAGRHVVVNVSRAVVDEARRRYRPLKVILVTAPASVLAERIARRGRENAAEIAERLARAAAPAPVGADVLTIENSGALEDAAAAFIAALRRCGD